MSSSLRVEKAAGKGPVGVIDFRAPAGPTRRIAAVGDISLSGRVMRGRDATPGLDLASERILELVSGADVAFGNLECVLVDSPAAPFEGPASAAAELAKVGFGVLHLANNHALDAGQTGLARTVALLERVGIRAVGAGASRDEATRLVVTDLGGVRIGWLAAGRTLRPQAAQGPAYCELDETELLDRVARARPGLDVLVLSVHTGYMYLDYPHPETRTLAHRLAAAGAGLVLMHHAHVLQGIEILETGSVVCYSLGNFLTDCREGHVVAGVVEDLQRQGGVFLFDIDSRGPVRVTVVPTLIDERFRVVTAEGNEGSCILDRLARVSGDLAGDFEAEFFRQRAARNTGLGVRMLVSLVRRGQFAELARQLARVRPRHAAMLGRWLLGARGRQ